MAQGFYIPKPVHGSIDVSNGGPAMVHQIVDYKFDPSGEAVLLKICPTVEPWQVNSLAPWRDFDCNDPQPDYDGSTMGWGSSNTDPLMSIPLLAVADDDCCDVGNFVEGLNFCASTVDGPSAISKFDVGAPYYTNDGTFIGLVKTYESNKIAVVKASLLNKWIVETTYMAYSMWADGKDKK